MAKTRKTDFQIMCVFSDESLFCGVLACTGAPRPLPTLQPAHRTKGSSDLASSEVTRIAATWLFWELVTGATGPRKWWQGLRLGAHLPHAPGARMMVVTQTPSNSLLNQNKFVHGFEHTSNTHEMRLCTCVSAWFQNRTNADFINACQLL